MNLELKINAIDNDMVEMWVNVESTRALISVAHIDCFSEFSSEFLDDYGNVNTEIYLPVEMKLITEAYAESEEEISSDLEKRVQRLEDVMIRLNLLNQS